jgi:excisionase family DNA binding protein
MATAKVQNGATGGAGLRTCREACDYLRLSHTKLYAMMGSGELPFVMIGGSRRLRAADLDELINRLLVRPGPAAVA